MQKQIFQTTAFMRIDKAQWPKYVKDFLDNPDVNSIHRYKNSPVFFEKFNTGSYPRIMFVEIVRGDVCLYVPRVYFHDHMEYNRFLTLSTEDMVKKGKFSDEEDKEIEEEIRKYEEPEELPNLPQEMMDIESQRDFSNIETSYVFEMEEWVRHIKNPEFVDDRRSIHALLQQVVVDRNYAEADDKGWITMSFQGSKSVVFRVSSLENHTYFYLFDISSNVDKHFLSQKYLVDDSNEVLLKKARKGYPDWIMYGDFEDWIKLENDDEANLALSDEEINVLNKTPYPYFVNGLAGSGKSTILYYLFAHAYAHRSVRKQSLLFLSYSKKLIKKAQSVVLALLKTNPSYSGFHMTEQDERDLNECFSPFIDFLKNNYLTTAAEIERFSSDNHISFERFQKLYNKECKLVEANSYSETIVWSVIRSFIKGRDYTKYFDINDYRSIQRDDRTVLTTDYEKIYKIFKNWYSPLMDEGKWDDLDLVRYVLQKMDREPNYEKYDIVYCDEAQDFTPIENKLVLRLSSYSQYNLSGYKKIPIAYAGDPNQTVSPTGFSWKRLKDVFSKSFEEQIGGFVSLKDKTLNNNYRSKRTIVEFANSLQYIRKCYLSDESLLPQEQWNPQANPLPGFFFIDSEEDKDFIRRGFEKTECIITGDEGEYEKELESDKLTAESTQISDALLETVNKTKLYTAISSKGLEFKAVILYRFADHLPSSFSKLLDGSQIGETEKYDLSHFFTKLYIAVSRAKEILYIVDSEENYDKFWKHFIDNEYVTKLLKSRQDYDSWKEKVGGIAMGDKGEFMKRMDENFNPLELAQSIFDDAMLSQDSKEMRRAVGYFEEAGSNENAELAKAYVWLYEHQYEQSGDKFSALNRYQQATEAYWKGACWRKLLLIKGEAQYTLAAQYMTGAKNLIDFISVERIVEKIYYTDDVWKKVVLQMKDDSQIVNEEYLFTVCDFFESLVERGFIFLNEVIAKLYYRNKKWNAAIKKWDTLRLSEHIDYYKAKIEVSNETSDAIYWMSKAKLDKDILSRYSSPKDIQIFNLDDRAKSIIFALLLSSSNRFKEAVDYPYDKEDRMRRLYYADKWQFLLYCVLRDFDLELYSEWVEQKVKDGDLELFENSWNSDTFDAMFRGTYLNVNGDVQYVWLDFLKLRDRNNLRLLKNECNVNGLLKAISTYVECEDMTPDNSTLTEKQKEKKRRFFCFMDCLFDDNYNYPRAKQYEKDLLNCLSDVQLFRDDFSKSSAQNDYFLTCEFDVKEYDQIKDNTRDFVIKSLGELKKIKDASGESKFRLLCMLYEKVIPFVTTGSDGINSKAIPDFGSVNKLYEDLKKQKKDGKLKDSAYAMDFVNARLAFNLIRTERRLSLASWMAKIEESRVSLPLMMETLDKENTIMFINKTFKSTSFDVEMMQKFIQPLSEKIYEFNLKLNDLDVRTRKNIRENMVRLVDAEIERLLGESRIDEYHLKLMGYAFEMALEKDQIAERYDRLIHDGRLVKLYRLVEYFKMRALNRYANMDSSIFQGKAKEYEVYKTQNELREYRRPQIHKSEGVPEEGPRIIFVDKDRIIDGVSVEIKSSKKIIWFSENGKELMTITKGEIDVEDDVDIQAEGSKVTLKPNFVVVVNSADETMIVVKDLVYKISFK